MAVRVIRPPETPMIDFATGFCTREWVYFFEELGRTGDVTQEADLPQATQNINQNAAVAKTAAYIAITNPVPIPTVPQEQELLAVPTPTVPQEKELLAVPLPAVSQEKELLAVPLPAVSQEKELLAVPILQVSKFNEDIPPVAMQAQKQPCEICGITSMEAATLGEIQRLQERLAAQEEWNL